MRTFGLKSFSLICATVLLGADPLSIQAAESLPPNVSLHIRIGATQQVLSLEDLNQRMSSATLKVFNPSYQRKLAYRGFWIEDLLRTYHFPKGAQVVFICRDGYTMLLPHTAIKKHKWLLAFMETSGQWTPLIQSKESVSPGPWYLIGSKKESFVDYPWPYAVVTIQIINSL